MKYTGSFINKGGQRIYITIITDNDESQVYNINASQTIRFSDDPIEIECKTSDMFEHIICSTCKIRFVSTEFLGVKFYSSNIYDTKVKVGTAAGAGDIWTGYVEPGTYNQPFAYEWDEFELNCIDYLATLQYFNYKNIDTTTYDNEKANATTLSMMAILQDILPGTVYWDGSKSVSLDSDAPIFSRTAIPTTLFFGESYDDIWTKEDILFEMLQYFNLHIISLGEVFLIFDWESMQQGKIWTPSHLYTNITGDIPLLQTIDNRTIKLEQQWYASDATNVSIADVYNTIALTCKLEDIDTVIESPMEADSCTTPYSNRQLYMREYFAESDQGLRDAINGIKSKDDTSLITDYYIIGKECSNWTFPTSTGYYDANGILVNQNKPLIEMGKNKNKIQCNLYGVGSVKGSTREDDTVTGKISMANCLIININGNGDDSGTSTFPTSTVLEASQPIAVFNGAVEGNFSPSDYNTTNYLVFSGDVTYAPIVDVSGKWWALEMTAPINGMWSPNKLKYEDKSYYCAREFKDYYETQDEMYYSNLEPWYPNTDHQFRKLEYKEKSGADSIKKLDVLECELKIGDKYCVETYDANGNSVYGWYTADNLPMVYDEYEKTYYARNTFALGINPKIGDFIIGQQYSFANNITVDMNLGDIEGIAIPIKQSDKLTGKIEFKILGPVNTQFDQWHRRHKTWFRKEKWTVESKYVLAHTSSIIIKNFECGITTNNAGLLNEGDSDLIYTSATNEKYLVSKDDIEFKFNTALTSAECASKGIKNTFNISNVLNTDGTSLLGIANNITGDYAKPEEHYIDQYYRLYYRPRLQMETEIHMNSRCPINTPFFKLWADANTGKRYMPTGYTYNPMECMWALNMLEVGKTDGTEISVSSGYDSNFTDWEPDIPSIEPDDPENPSTPGGSGSTAPSIDTTSSVQFYAIEDSSFTCSMNAYPYMYTTGAAEWQTWDGSRISLKAGQSLYLKGTGGTRASMIDIQGKVKCSGNALDLLGPNVYELYDNCFENLFMSAYGLYDASELILPNIELKPYCYSNMFESCGNLKYAPELPSTTLAEHCYGDMFQNCYSLETAPALPATNLADWCYANMFEGCLLLGKAPALPAITLKDSCYHAMFKGCQSLIKTPELPATTLAQYCYAEMFMGCTALTTISDIDAINLADSCCKNMFTGCHGITKAYIPQATRLAPYCYSYMYSNCTGLITIPDLPATVMVESCYEYMFSGCTTLNIAPDLPATQLAQSCYQYMFDGCTNLTYGQNILPAMVMQPWCYRGMYQSCNKLQKAPILPALSLATECYSVMFGWSGVAEVTALFLDIDDTLNALDRWLTNVPDSGYFYMNEDATWILADHRGVSGVPTNWAVSTTTYDDATQTEVLVTGVVLNTNTVMVTEGDTYTLVASVRPNNATNKGISWNTDNKTVAIVSNGVVTTLTPGTAKITVTTDDGGYTATCIVTVNAKEVEEPEPETIPVTGVTLNKSSLTLTEGDAFTLEATVMPADADNKSVTWTSSTEYVATVDQTGKVTCKTEGITVIIVTTKDGGFTATCTVTVNAAVTEPEPEEPETIPVTGVTINYSTASFEVGTTYKLAATVLPTNADDKTVTWTSNNTAVATVNDGLVTGVSEGSTIITVTTNDGNYTATCIVTVNAKEVEEPEPDVIDTTKAIKFTPETTECTVALTNVSKNNLTLYYTNGTDAWAKWDGSEILVPAGTSLYVKGTNTTLNPSETIATNTTSIFKIEGGNTKCTGNVMYLLGENVTYVPPYCFARLFNQCSFLTAAPDITATYVDAGGCYFMFNECSRLVDAPTLPATTLGNYAYAGMFQNCTSLVTAPDLLATEGGIQCYGTMFSGCTALNYIKMMLIEIDSGGWYCTQNWAPYKYQTYTEGTFVKNVNATWDLSGADGVPLGWTVTYA